MKRLFPMLLLAALAGTLAVPGLAEEVREEKRIDAYRESERAFALGLASQRRGDRATAIGHYEAALAADPEFVEAQVNLVRALMDEGDFARANELLDAVESKRPEYPAVHSVRGLLALRESNPSLALDAFEEAKRLSPRDVEVLVNSGAALLEQGLFDEARRLLERAVRLEPNNADAALNLAIAEDHSGRLSHAAFGYRRFLSLVALADPDRERVAERLRILTDDPNDLPDVAHGVRATQEGN